MMFSGLTRALKRFDVQALWNYRASDMRIIIEQNRDVVHFSLSAGLQVFMIRATLTLGAGVIAFGASMLSLSTLLYLQNDTLAAQTARLTAFQDTVSKAVQSLDPNKPITGSDVMKFAEILRRQQGAIASLAADTERQLKEVNSALQNALNTAGLNANLSGKLLASGGLPEPLHVAELSPVNLALVAEMQLNQRLRYEYGVLPSDPPLSNPRVSSGFGPRIHPVTGRADFHPGIDLLSSDSSNIRSPLPGNVRWTGRLVEYGNTVIVSHSAGVETLYAHMDRIYVAAGDALNKGSLIGTVGSTGLSTGPHLHFEVSVDGQKINPLIPLEVGPYVR